MRPEEKFMALNWRAFRRAARADHTRNLARPWYISGRVGDNSIRARWERQARRYAEWYVREVEKLDGFVRDVRRVGCGAAAIATACVVTGGQFRYVTLPDHIAGGVS